MREFLDTLPISHPVFLYLSRLLIAGAFVAAVVPFRARLAAFGRRFATRGEQDVSEPAAIDPGDLRRTSLYASLGAFPALLFFGFNVWLSFVMSLALLVALPGILERRARNAFHASFDEALPDALLGVSSSLRAGLTIQKSLEVATQSTAEVFAGEAARCLKEYALGTPIDLALDNVRARVTTPASNMAFGAMIIGRQLGGPLPDILRRIAETVRERLRVEGRLRALTAQGRAQGAILCSAPVGVGAGMAILSPEKFALMTDTGPGQVLLAVATIMWLLGMIVTWKVMQLDV